MTLPADGVFAFDPGETTGWAVYMFNGDYFDCGETTGQQEFCQYADACATAWGGGTADMGWVGEGFRITAETGKKTAAYWSLEIIGTVRYLIHPRELTLQAPGDAKRFATNDMLKRLGWYRPSPGGHQADATRHLVKRLVDLGWRHPDLLPR